jgi:hypothetical protein
MGLECLIEMIEHHARLYPDRLSVQIGRPHAAQVHALINDQGLADRLPTL